LSDDTWKRCSVCKKPIALGALYWTCNVSTCNRKRTALRFCTVSCWDAHLPFANHREAWAEEQTAPTRLEPESPSSQPAQRGKRRIVPSTPAATSRPNAPPREVLIVASRLKDYVRAKSGYNTSDGVLAPLSDVVRHAVDEAIANARREGRMTVLDRDVPES
jgi:hypothetical protein